MAPNSLSPEEQRVLHKVLTTFKRMCPPGHPEWYDLSERTKLSPEKTLIVLNKIMSKLNEKEVKK